MIYVGPLTMTTEPVLGVGILSPKTLRKIKKCQNLLIVAGANSMDIFPQIA